MIKKILWCFLGCFALWFGGLVWFVDQIPAAQTEPEKADAIVILTGGKGRLEYSLRLLTQGKGKALFITGVGNIANFDELLHRLPSDLQHQVHALSPSAIELGREAENTIGNAQETARWAEAHAIKTLLVVTSNYHMPRALLEFGEIMPQVTVIPAPLLVGSGGYDWRLLFSEYHKFLAAKFRHRLVAVLK
jgi:uncharacterized SAM-binding protein YcdF (DUF218 family)